LYESIVRQNLFTIVLGNVLYTVQIADIYMTTLVGSY